ncbi:M17 family peptidase N-terminal domain-containing protein [Anaeromyxobacter paludicola]|uniref:Peptidase M17 leucyl aminopeptidase N-terminal domain-containing protein n=1 Tax=Anaeromyxobacter paludicola TaxID=2918171 RepID=A0ABM7X554_9BACT|nr:M17 family peptidase N-terminal domain-containing protein [Anaeromyxobacter paludicola]BDG06931.1 hypothetical protein AMPC_00440 [Anaeromyxobacter paludicola]
MTLRLELAELGLPALDALDVDALAVFVGPERPLQGLAGFADWRLCGALSRAIREHHFDGGYGEALLIPSAGRLPVDRIFCFGTGEAPLDAAAYGALLGKACEAMQRARSEAFATSLPPARAEGEGAVPAARLWVEACARFQGRRQVLLGDSRALARDLGVAKQALGADIDVLLPTARVEMPPRPMSLPPPGHVVR